jgi:hypothetical protein
MKAALCDRMLCFPAETQSSLHPLFVGCLDLLVDAPPALPMLPSEIKEKTARDGKVLSLESE